MQSWFWLSIAVIAEVFATIALKASDGFTKIYPVLIVIIGYSITFIALAKVLQLYIERGLTFKWPPHKVFINNY